MKFLITFIIALAFIILIPKESEYKVTASYSLEKEATAEPKVKVELAVMPVDRTFETATAKTDIEQMICKLWGEDCKTALAVARCESGLRPDAIGDHAIAYVDNGIEYGKSYGIFQIRHLQGRPEPTKLLDPVFNIEYAYNLYKRSGFQPWSAYTNNCYLAFL